MEKRQYFRVKQCLISEIIADNTNLFAMTANLSASGLFLKSKRCLPVDSLITINIVLPDDSLSSLKGIVRRAIDTSIFIHNGMGIQIIEKDGNYNRYLQSVVDELEPGDEKKITDVCSETRDVSIQEEKNTVINPELDKRRSRRFILYDKQVDIMIGSSGELNVVDISTGGISFKTEKRLVQNEHYVIQLSNKDRALTLQGAVKWNALHEYRKLASRREELLPIYIVGMQFTDLLGHTSEEVEQFIAGLTKFDTLYHSNNYINLSDLIVPDSNELMVAMSGPEYQNSLWSHDREERNTGERHGSALYYGRQGQASLFEESNKKMVLSILENKKISESEVERLVTLRTMPEEAFKIIIRNRTWMKHYGIVSALVNNPKVPPFLAAPLLKKLKRNDLVKLKKNSGVSETLRSAARRLLIHKI
jgi:hypothetical protein